MNRLPRVTTFSPAAGLADLDQRPLTRPVLTCFSSTVPSALDDPDAGSIGLVDDRLARHGERAVALVGGIRTEANISGLSSPSRLSIAARTWMRRVAGSSGGDIVTWAEKVGRDRPARVKRSACPALTCGASLSRTWATSQTEERSPTVKGGSAAGRGC